MRFIYGYDEALPTRGADSEQVLNTVAAVSRAGIDVQLLTVRPRHQALSCEELKRHYAVDGDFSIEQLGRHASSRVPGGRAATKLGHAARVAQLSGGSDVVVHTRHLSVASAALVAGRRVLYETYRPWPAQYPALVPALKYLVSHRRLLGVVLHSHHAAASFRDMGVDPAKLIVIHNGWAPSRMEPRLTRAEAREQLGLSTGQAVVTYSGRVDPEKGLDIVLEIARRCPSVRFLIVGSRDPSGPLERAGRRIENVAFVPWQDYAATTPYLYAADVLITPPSLAPLQRAGNTVLPMKMFLYLAAGRVILAPHAPDLEELLRHEENALLVEPGSSEAAAAAVMRAVSDAALFERIAAGAVADAAGLTWDARGQRIVDFTRERLTASL